MIRNCYISSVDDGKNAEMIERPTKTLENNDIV